VVPGQKIGVRRSVVSYRLCYRFHHGAAAEEIDLATG